MSAVDDWEQELGDLLNYSLMPNRPIPVEQFHEVVQRSRRWIESLDQLIETMTMQIVSLRQGEAQWRGEGQDETRGHPMFGCVGKMPDGMKPEDEQ